MPVVIHVEGPLSSCREDCNGPEADLGGTQKRSFDRPVCTAFKRELAGLVVRVRAPLLSNSAMSQDDDGLGELSAALAAAGGRTNSFMTASTFPCRKTEVLSR